ncbi:MAG: PaaI family thioesterase [Ktedonobacteraceae bacterium]|nr:PaaI family thioesterase [Ktedonobacteraceae bacterium]
MTQFDQAPPSVDAIRQNALQSGYFQLLDMHIDQAQDGEGAVSTHVDARLYHPQQIVHGGVIFTLADTAMAMALMSVLPAGTRTSTIEAKINFLLPVRTGELSASAVIVHRGRSTAVLEATVHNTNGSERETIARVLGTFHISVNRA